MSPEKDSDKSLGLMMEGCAPKIQYSFLAFGTCTTLCLNFEKNFKKKREDIMEVVPVSCGDCFAFEFPSKINSF